MDGKIYVSTFEFWCLQGFVCASLCCLILSALCSPLPAPTPEAKADPMTGIEIYMVSDMVWGMVMRIVVSGHSDGGHPPGQGLLVWGLVTRQPHQEESLRQIWRTRRLRIRQIRGSSCHCQVIKTVQQFDKWSIYNIFSVLHLGGRLIRDQQRDN